MGENRDEYALGDRLCTVSIWGNEKAVPLRFPSADLSVGERVDCYQVKAEIGRGGMAVVYAARDAQLDREVALKIVAPRMALHSVAVARFMREARILAQADHVGVVKLFRLLEHKGSLVMVMERVSGPSLAQITSTGNSIPYPDAVSVICQVLEALDHTHALGIIHRDISQGNVVWCERSGRYRLIDFGLARAIEDGLELSLQGVALGTPAFMSPEQARGAPVDCRCDIFSVGVLLYRLLTGVYPHPAETSVGLTEFLRSDQPFPPERIGAVKDEALVRIVANAIKKGPADRYGSAGAMREALRGWMDTEPTARTNRQNGLAAYQESDWLDQALEPVEESAGGGCDSHSWNRPTKAVLVFALLLFLVLALLAFLLIGGHFPQ